MRNQLFYASVSAALLLAACGGEPRPSSPVLGDDEQSSSSEPDPDGQSPTADVMMAPGTHVATIVLETRSGESAQGWSLALNKSVRAAEADLTIASSDCGARGRWVTLEGHDLRFCSVAAAACSAAPSLEIGGSNPSTELGDSFYLVRDGVKIGQMTLLERSETPFEWYESIKPFVVVLELER